MREKLATYLQVQIYFIFVEFEIFYRFIGFYFLSQFLVLSFGAYHTGDRGQNISSSKYVSNLSGDTDLPGSDGVVDKETLRRVKAAAEEFLLNGLLTEAMEVLKELVHPYGMKDVIRCLFNFVVEKKIEEVEKFFPFIPAMHTCSLLGKNSFHDGLVDFLDGYDDLTVDVPLAGKSTALLLSYILMNSTDLFDFNTFTNIPQENMFADSPRFVDLIAQILQEITEKRSVHEAEAMYKKSPDLESTIRGKTLSSRDIEEIASKYNLPFLVPV